MYDITRFDKINDYLPILNGIITADLLFLIIVYYMYNNNSDDEGSLLNWYKEFGLSAFIADFSIIFIGLILTRYIFKIYKLKNNIIIFILVALFLQIFHDILFYVFFSAIPKNKNEMIDFFKIYAEKQGKNAIIGDSILVVMSILLASMFAGLTFNTNIILLSFLIYLLPYAININ